MKSFLYSMVLMLLICFVPILAFSEDNINIPNVLWEEKIITKDQGESKDMASSWDENGSPNFPYKIYDGDLETKWCTQSEDISWLKIDFMEPRLVSKFVIYMAGNGAHGGDLDKWGYNFTDFQIQSSMTGKDDSWVDEVVVKGNLPDKEHGILTFDIKSKPIRWVRLYITGKGQDKNARCPEFQVWGLLTAAVSPSGKLATTWAIVKHGN